MKKWLVFPWYPLAFSLYPALALLGKNVGQVKPQAAVRPLIASLLLGLVLFSLLALWMRDRYRAAFLGLLLLILFFTYGHIRMYLLNAIPESRIVWLLPVSSVFLAALAVWWATRPRIQFEVSTAALNVIMLGLVMTAAVQVALGSRSDNGHSLGAANAPVMDLTLPPVAPDVYYFILDSYGRGDLLQRAYGYDNSGFVDGLRERGFYVAECSQSNYVRTELSLAATLNMSYLQGLDPAFVPESIRRSTLWASLKHSAVRYNFESMGYKTIAFANGYAWSELEDADVFYTPPPFSAGLSEFETLFLQTTLALHLEDLGWVNPDEITGQNFRNRTLLVFDRIDDIVRMSEPTFAQIHVISPHPPFVFGPDGEHTDPAAFWNEKRLYPRDLYAKGYTNQLTFLNEKMLEAVDTILKGSTTAPIIVIQGDHGPWLQPGSRRFWILNAHYLPGETAALYPSISPVNSFRVIFDAFFGGDYELLPDVSYFSPVPKLYEFSEVPYPCDN